MASLHIMAMGILVCGGLWREYQWLAVYRFVVGYEPGLRIPEAHIGVGTFI